MRVQWTHRGHGLTLDECVGSAMGKVWKGQRSFYKYDPAQGDFYKFTPDASRKTLGKTFAPKDRI